MDSTEFSDIIALERSGRLGEAKQRLLQLASQGHPLGLLELSQRYLLDPLHEPDRYTPGLDTEKSKVLADEAVQTLEELADCGDAEAMLYLARVHLGDYGPWYDSEEVAEHWLLLSVRAGCQSAENDLQQFYLDREQRQSEHGYQKT